MELTDGEGRVLGDQPGDLDALEIIKNRISNLPQADRDLYRHIMRICETEGGCSISLKVLPTEKRFNIARGLTTLFRTGDFHPDLVTALTRHVTGNQIHHIGRAIASLTLQQSRTFAWIANMLVWGDAELVYDHNNNTFHIKETLNV